MVKFSDVQKDIEKLEKETGTLFVDYNRLHRYSHAEKSEYDWKVLFEPAKKLWGSDYKNLLLNESIIRPVSDGGYIYNGNSSNLALGGGENYLINNRHLVVCSLNPNRETLHTCYHEAAHSLQRKQHLFNGKKIEKIYRFCEKGMTRRGKTALAAKLFNRYLYKRYLNEAHADAFAGLCMLLRAENDIDCKLQKIYNYTKSILKTFIDFMDPSDVYPSAKYYSSLPVCKAVLQKFDYWRRKRQLKRFYAPDGSLNLALISRETAKIVFKHAYTPYNFKKLPRRDQLEAVVNFYPAAILFPGKLFRQAKNFFRHYLINLKAGLHHSPTALLSGEDKESRIISACCRIDNAKTGVLAACASDGWQNGFVLPYLALIANMRGDGGTAQKHLEELKKTLDSSFNRKEIFRALDNYVTVIKKAYRDNADIPEFHPAVQYLTAQQQRDALWRIRQEKSQNPQKPILAPLLQIVRFRQRTTGQQYQEERQQTASSASELLRSTLLRQLRKNGR